MDFIESDAEKEKYGEKFEYDPSGPFKKTRVRTDFCWLVGFIFYLIIWSIIIIYAFSKGDISKLMGPTDSEGRVCGQDDLVYEKPYLVYCNKDSYEESNWLACHYHCPDTDFIYENKKDLNDSSLEDTKKQMICQADVKLDKVDSWEQLDYLVDNDLCAREYRQSEPSDRRCSSQDDNRFEEDTWRYTLPRMSQDIMNSKFSIIGFIMLSGFITVLIIFLMRWCAVALVCGSILLLCSGIIYSIYKDCVNIVENKTNHAFLSLFIDIVMLVLFALVPIYFRRKIYLACQMIRESSKAIICILSSLCIPFILIIIYLLILTLGASAGLFLTTIESPIYRAQFADNESCQCQPELDFSQNSICDPLSFENDCKTREGKPCVLSGCYMVGKETHSVGFLHFINFLGLFWSYWFVLGFGDMVLASVFATWYWTFNKKILSYLTVIENFWRVSMYHLGTIALGSFIIFVCGIIRFMLSITCKTLQKANKPVAALILLNLKCVTDAMEKFLNFVNRRAYIMCAVHGTDFISSARMAFYLLMRNIGKVIVVVEMTNVLIFILTVLIACITAKISESYYETRDDLTFLTIPRYIILLGSLLTAWLLLRVVQIAVDTIFQCFLEDSERNDGSHEKPYFMSEELIKFLYKK